MNYFFLMYFYKNNFFERRDCVMKGYIEKYFFDKQYGFIKTDDNVDYFFHKTNFINSDEIEECLLVEFDTEKSKKGLVATNIKIVTDASKYIKQNNNSDKYIKPHDVLISKNSKIPNWDIVEKSNWQIIASSKDSPDDAKDQLKDLAANNDVSGLINIRYFKTKGEKGNYKFTIHNFNATCVNIGRKSDKGNFTKKQLFTNIDKRFSTLTDNYRNEYKKNMTRCLIIWLISISCIITFNVSDLFRNYIIELTNISTGLFLLLGTLALTIVFGTTKYKGYWLSSID